MWTIVGIYIGLAVLGVALMIAFVDQLPACLTRGERRGDAGGVSAELRALLLATLRHLRHREQLFLIPLTVFSGLEQAFVGAEFNKVRPFVQQ